MKAFKHAKHGILHFSTTNLTAAPEIRLVVYTPMDDDTWEVLAKLRGAAR